MINGLNALGGKRSYVPKPVRRNPAFQGILVVIQVRVMSIGCFRGSIELRFSAAL